MLIFPGMRTVCERIGRDPPDRSRDGDRGAVRNCKKLIAGIEYGGRGAYHPPRRSAVLRHDCGGAIIGSSAPPDQDFKVTS